VRARGIVIPPLGMSTGLTMFVSPAMRVPWSWAAAAFVAGATLLAIPLSHTSKLHREGDTIVMRRSPAFLAILLILVAARFALRTYIDRFISPLQTAAIFFLLAFGMILSWRTRMLLEYRRLARVHAAPANSTQLLGDF
jgi:membrane protein CcdC involved in cytochrome C biogenesis